MNGGIARLYWRFSWAGRIAVLAVRQKAGCPTRPFYGRRWVRQPHREEDICNWRMLNKVCTVDTLNVTHVLSSTSLMKLVSGPLQCTAVSEFRLKFVRLEHSWNDWPRPNVRAQPPSSTRAVCFVEKAQNLKYEDAKVVILAWPLSE